MKREEFEKEIKTARASDPNSLALANAAENRLLRYFDEVQRELGYVAALRRNLNSAIDENVDLEVEVQGLRRKLAAKADSDSEGDDE